MVGLFASQFKSIYLCIFHGDTKHPFKKINFIDIMALQDIPNWITTSRKRS